MPEPGRRRETLLDDLPEETVVDQILIRLPSKDVGRCRAVSTSWRSATSTPEFMLQHHRRQPSLPIVRDFLRNYFVLAAAGACSQQLWPFVPRDKQNRLHAACDGFLVVCRRHQYYIYNPVTRKHALLSMPPDSKPVDPQGHFFVHNTPIGFYRHHPTREYRVLYASLSYHLRHSRSLYVLTVASDEPRCVTVRMPTVSPPSSSVEHDLLIRMCNSSPPVHHRGSLHWCPFGASNITGGAGDIVVFDTEAESFRWMHSPQSLPHKLFNMTGMLALCAGSDDGFDGFAIMDVWVMQDYEAEIWTFKYRIDVSMVEASRQLYLSSSKEKNEIKCVDSMVHGFNDMDMLNERELLIMFNHGHVLRCDIDGKFLGMVKVNTGKGPYWMELTHHRLQESIIPIPSHEMQGEDE